MTYNWLTQNWIQCIGPFYNRQYAKYLKSHFNTIVLCLSQWLVDIWSTHYGQKIHSLNQYSMTYNWLTQNWIQCIGPFYNRQYAKYLKSHFNTIVLCLSCRLNAKSTVLRTPLSDLTPTASFGLSVGSWSSVVSWQQMRTHPSRTSHHSRHGHRTTSQAAQWK